MRRVLALTALALLVLTPAVFGQAQRGAIEVTVTDADGAALPGATVSAVSDETLTRRTGQCCPGGIPHVAIDCCPRCEPRSASSDRLGRAADAARVVERAVASSLLGRSKEGARAFASPASAPRATARAAGRRLDPVLNLFQSRFECQCMIVFADSR